MKPGAQIKCPNCNSPIQARVSQLIDVGADPGAKSRLLSGRFNFVQCPVCGFQGQVASPLVYHDPEKELLLTYMPVELSMPKEEQERIIGQSINRVTERLPPEDRKAYLLQPQSVLTMQGLIERILEADGITKEELDAQREKLRTFEDLLRVPEDELEGFVQEHDEQLDGTFFQLASISLQTTQNETARNAAAQRLERALELSTYGKELEAQEQEVQKAAESLQALGESLTREELLDLFVEAPNDQRVIALTNLTRPALDYEFFQLLSNRIDEGGPPESERLSQLRDRVLEITEQMDQVQEARINQAANLLRSLMDSENLDQDLRSVIPAVDELFLGVLQANIRSAQERGDSQRLEKLSEIDSKLRELIEESLPQGLKLAQKVLSLEDEEAAKAMLEESSDQIDETVLNSLMTASQRLLDAGEEQAAARMKTLHRYALRLSMRRSMQSEGK